MVIVDTSVWVEYFNLQRSAETEWLHEALDRQPLGLTDMILCEVLQGLRGENDFRQIQTQLSRLTVHNSGGEHLAVAAARNYRTLRSQGITVRKTIDCLIATFCIERSHELLHRDRDFEAFERLGLQVVRS